MVKYGAVHLSVVDLEKSINFWTEVIGLHLITKNREQATLGVEYAALVILYEDATQNFKPGYSGLYHLAIHVPTEADLANILFRLIKLGYPMSPTDHIMSKAIYLEDPNRITVEITLETPERFRKYLLEEDRVGIIDTDGNLRGITERLDVSEVLKHHSQQSENQLPAKTKVGHVHLYVNDLTQNAEFYEKLGFQQHLFSSNFGFADFSLGGEFKHRLAMNTWQSLGAPQAPKGTAGLKYFELQLAHKEKPAGHDYIQTEAGNFLTDPAGNKLLILD